MSDSFQDAVSPLLRGRWDTLGRDIVQTEEILRTIPEPLLSRIEGRLGTQLRRLRRRAELSSHSKDTEVSASWSELHRLTAELGMLSDECLALAGGAALRRIGAASRVCILADQLLDEVVARAPLEWSSFTIPATQEYYVRSSRVIRVRLPGSELWDLPAAVHELGHFVGPAIADDSLGRTSHPFEETLHQLSRDHPKQAAWFAELFADAFATWAIGPAYGYMCVGDRLDPVGANVGTQTHPAASLRMEMVHETLGAQIAHVKHNFGPEKDLAEKSAILLKETWLKLVQEAGSSQISKGDTEIMAITTDKLVCLLDEYLPLIPWNGWSTSAELASRFRSEMQAHSNRIVDMDSIAQFPDFDLRDLLNVAWIMRFDGAALDDREYLGWLTRNVTEMAMRLVSKTDSTPRWQPSKLDK